MASDGGREQRAIDFGASFVTFFTERGHGNIARLQVQAACTLVPPGGEPETYYLIAPCRAEHMYRETGLFQMPNYEFAGIFGSRDHRILRYGWSSAGDRHEYGAHRDRFLDVRVDVRSSAVTVPLPGVAEIVEATLANVPLVARTELVDERTARRAILEYPIWTINVTRDPMRFQVDTGPLIVPDFASTAAHAVEQLAVVFAVYNRLDRAELIARRPTPLVEGAGPELSSTVYSAAGEIAARHTILRVR